VPFAPPIPPLVLKTLDNPDGVDKSVYDGVIAAMRQDRPKFFATGVSLLLGTGAVSPEMSQWAVSLFVQASPKATIDLVRAFSETDFRPDMRAFTVPTLIVQGDADLVNPVERSGRKRAQAIPGSQLTIYEGGPHGVFITHKDRFTRDLLGFVQS
jgi:pimeloyl-ACP methyl ester carboxylesterase